MSGTPGALFKSRPQYGEYDVVIIGGATLGTTIAWFLASNTDFVSRDAPRAKRVLVVERDPTLRYSATKASNNCMRQQFATEINVKIGQYAAEFVKNFRQLVDPKQEDAEVPDLPIRPFGYLYLSDNDEFTEVLRKDHAVQERCGAGTQIVSAGDIADKYPFYRLDDIVAGSLNTVDEGFFDAWKMVQVLRRKGIELGVDYIDNEVVDIQLSGDRATGVVLKTGEYIRVAEQGGKIINAAGTRAAAVAALAGIRLPIEARRRYTYVFEPLERNNILDRDLPLTIDPTGVHFRQFGDYDYLAGCPPLGSDEGVDVDDFSYESEDVWTNKLLPVLSHRVPQFGSIKVTDSWVGHYEFNTFDHNAILGFHDQVKNFGFACGFSGHGSQQFAACGRGVAELIVYGAYKSLDLSVLDYNRIPENRPVVERGVI